MDNFTHSLAGWALGQAGLKTKTRKGLAALILGANMPDLDVFVSGGFPWEPLAIHRGFTHSLIGGIIVLPPVLFGFLMLLDRWQERRGKPFKSGLALHKGWLLALCYLGVLTHPLLDLQTTYAVQLFTPFSGEWWHSDTLFIIDVWVWTLLAGSIAWSRWREKRGREWKRPVQAAIGIFLAYLGLNSAITVSAVNSLPEVATCDAPTIAFASPPPAWSWQRDVAWRYASARPPESWFVYNRAHYAPFSGWSKREAECSGRPDHMADPVVQKAIRNDPSLKRFLAWSVMPVASIKRGRCEARVTIADYRYGDPDRGTSRINRETVVPIAGPGC